MSVRSPVWDFFTKCEDKIKCVCNICKQVLSCQAGNTKTPMNHFKNKHPQTHKLVIEKQSTQKAEKTKSMESQPKITAFTPTGSNTAYDKNSGRHFALNRAVTKMLSVDLRPISMVDDEGFRDLVSLLDPRYVMPSRTTFSRKIIPQMFREERTKLFDLLKLGNYNALSITSDVWTSRAHDVFICFTGHFLNDDFVLKRFVSDTLYFPEQHTADTIITKLCFCA